MANPPIREEVARRVCRALDWTDALGQPKLMSCKVGLLRLHRGGWIELPAPLHGNGNGNGLVKQRIELPTEEPVVGDVRDLSGLHLAEVSDKAASALWNGLVDRYHYLGYKPLPGAQLRYLIRWDGGVLGAIGFGAAAWKVGARDCWIGWDAATREKQLGRLLNNARFLGNCSMRCSTSCIHAVVILPWVRVPNLASKVLAMSARQLPVAFELRYGVRPVLLETFVETGRFQGTCYRAASWCCLGQTAGRGKLDRYKRRALPVKDIYVHPLTGDFRQALGVCS